MNHSETTYKTGQNTNPMSKIKIKYFGPINEGYLEDDGFMDIKKVTVFIGNQGSGKSTVAKVISTLVWIEKALNRGDIDTFHLTKADFFDLFEYQRIHNYFREETIIEYFGDRASIKFNNKQAHPEFQLIEDSHYDVPQIMYVPAERNFLSTVHNAFDVKGLPGSLFEFAEEVKKAQFALNGNKLDLPVSGLQFRYDKRKDESYLVGNDYEINFLEASSGYQSLVPLYLVTKFLSDYISKGDKTLREQLSPLQNVRRNNEITEISLNISFSDEEKQRKVAAVEAKYLSKCLINIVEEPEQNLFPSSQQKILNSLLEFNNMNKSNKLIITTHSPYLINYLSIAIQGSYLFSEIANKGNSKDLFKRLESVVPIKAIVSGDDVIVYQLDEEKGEISKLGNTEGIPSDKNFLNQSIRHGNEMFDSLLEIEEEL